MPGLGLRCRRPEQDPEQVRRVRRPRAALETYAGIVMDRVPVIIATNSSFGQPLLYVVATALSDATVP